MASSKPITIVGGGLAGLTLGIGLRQRGVPVRLCEAGHYPRHRVCGEFISGRGLETLARLNLQDLILREGARRARTAAFFSRRTASRTQLLPSPALCVSRFILDNALAKEFRRLGGELHEGERWPAAMMRARGGRETFSGEGIVRATGRHAQPTENGWRWFGLKAHVRDVSLMADLEMHVASNGYVGLCGLANGEVNVCGLFRRRVGMEAAGHSREVLFGDAGSLLHERLAGAVVDENSFCSVAGLRLKPQRAAALDECCIGDAITMIPPMTGNGMSMAFESAELAIEPLVDWSRDQISWSQAQRLIAGGCDNAFNRRLAWATRLQALVLRPMLQRPFVWLVSRSDRFWRGWFERTR
jgi:2-polyprenyl-6-methoxyphenol hydroxylase-like FAD-dependent oxidoreductase